MSVYEHGVSTNDHIGCRRRDLCVTSSDGCQRQTNCQNDWWGILLINCWRS